MMQCRMCSQRLPRPGKLCRECERELERARHMGASIGELTAMPPLAASRRLGAGWLGRLHGPGAVVAAAFAVGLAGAVGLHVVDASQSRVASRSIMLDAPPATSRPRLVSLDASPVVLHDDRQRGERTSPPAARAVVAREVPVTPAQVPPLRAASQAPEAAKVALRTPAPPEASVHADPARALGAALARCGDEVFFARPGCEERARSRYCDAATAQLPQCVSQPRDYGQ